MRGYRPIQALFNAIPGRYKTECVRYGSEVSS